MKSLDSIIKEACEEVQQALLTKEALTKKEREYRKNFINTLKTEDPNTSGGGMTAPTRSYFGKGVDKIKDIVGDVPGLFWEEQKNQFQNWADLTQGVKPTDPNSEKVLQYAKELAKDKVRRTQAKEAIKKTIGAIPTQPMSNLQQILSTSRDFVTREPITKMFQGITDALSGVNNRPSFGGVENLLTKLTDKIYGVKEDPYAGASAKDVAKFLRDMKTLGATKK